MHTEHTFESLQKIGLLYKIINFFLSYGAGYLTVFPPQNAWLVDKTQAKYANPNNIEYIY